MVAYHHTQPGYAAAGILGIGIVLLLGAGLIFGWEPAVTAVLFTFVLLFPIFSFMTVEVDDRYLSFRLGLLPLKRRIPLSEIHEVRPVKNRWYHGWGIHMTSGGWLYNVSGMKSVEVHFDSGKSLRIGTDEPNELVSAILQARAMAS